MKGRRSIGLRSKGKEAARIEEVGETVFEARSIYYFDHQRPRIPVREGIKVEEKGELRAVV